MRRLLIYFVLGAVTVFGWICFAKAESVDYFQAVERCDARGKPKAEYENEVRVIDVDTPCWSGHKVPKQMPSQASELRVYAYDLGECEYQARFHRSRADLMPASGLVLSTAIRQEIEALLPKAIWEQGSSPCFEPHHALVWLDESGRELASAEICFTCAGFALRLSEQDQPPVERKDRYAMIELDLAKLQRIFKDVGVPMTLKLAREDGAKGEWAESVGALCKLEALRQQGSRTQPRAPYAKRCVQLPDRIQY